MTNRIAESEEMHGYEPGLFVGLMKKSDSTAKGVSLVFLEGREKAKTEAFQNSLSTSNHSNDVREAEAKVMATQAEYMRVEGVHEKISKVIRKAYAIDKSIEKLENELAIVAKGIFHRRERKELQAKIFSEH